MLHCLSLIAFMHVNQCFKLNYTGRIKIRVKRLKILQIRLIENKDTSTKNNALNIKKTWLSKNVALVYQKVITAYVICAKHLPVRN